MALSRDNESLLSIPTWYELFFFFTMLFSAVISCTAGVVGIYNGLHSIRVSEVIYTLITLNCVPMLWWHHCYLSLCLHIRMVAQVSPRGELGKETGRGENGEGELIHPCVGAWLVMQQGHWIIWTLIEYFLHSMSLSPHSHHHRCSPRLRIKGAGEKRQRDRVERRGKEGLQGNTPPELIIPSEVEKCTELTEDRLMSMPTEMVEKGE